MSVPKSLAGQHVNVAMMTSGGRIFVAVSDVCCVVPSHTISHTIRTIAMAPGPGSSSVVMVETMDFNMPPLVLNTLHSQPSLKPQSSSTIYTRRSRSVLEQFGGLFDGTLGGGLEGGHH